MAEFKRFKTAKGFTVNSALIGIKDNGEAYPCGFLTMGNKLYKVTTSPSNKAGIKEWVTIQECKAKPSNY